MTINLKKRETFEKFLMEVLTLLFLFFHTTVYNDFFKGRKLS